MERLPEPLRERPFSVREAADLGVAVTRLRRRELSAPFRGVRVPSPAESDLESRCLAYLARMPAGQYFSHQTAARLWGMWLPTLYSEFEQLHITAPLPGRAPRIPGVTAHHVEAALGSGQLLRGIPVSTPLETVRCLAAKASIDDLVAIFDSARVRSGALLTESELLHVLAKHRGGRGVRKLRAAYELSRAGVDSRRETILRLGLVRAGLPEPEVNGVISRPGEPLRFGDLVFRDWRVVAEYEGKHHQRDRASYASDIVRFEQLHADWRFIRVLDEDLADFPAIVRRILLARWQ
jgi:hypothetical protein